MRRIHSVGICLVSVVALGGCASTADLAEGDRQSSVCEVHHTTMTFQVVDCASGGSSGYRREYSRACSTEFPHHGRLHFSEDHGYLYARHLRTFVCADCTRAHDQWQTEHPNK